MQKEKQTNRKGNRGWVVEGEGSVFPISCPVAGLRQALLSQFPVVYFLLLPLPMLGRFLSSLTYFIHRKGCPALCLVIEAAPLACPSISGSQGCPAWERLRGRVPKSALHALLFLCSLIRVHTMKTTATASFSNPPPAQGRSQTVFLSLGLPKS